MRLAVCFFLLAFLCCISETKAYDARFYSINDLHGISVREAGSVCEDDYGFIWASTKTGILRLTEDNFRFYQLPLETANILTVRLVYKKGILLAFTNNGQIFRYNPITDGFKMLVNMGSVLRTPYLNLNRVLIEDEKKIWISSSWGLFSYIDTTLTRIHEDGKEVFDIHWYKPSQFFIAKEYGVSIFNTQTLSFDTLFTWNFRVKKLYFDKLSEKLWLGTMSNGLFSYDFNTGQYSAYLNRKIPRQPILAIESNSDSTLMIGIDGQGIWELNSKKEEIKNVHKEDPDDRLSLRGNGVYDIFYDDNNRVWVCTYSGGVSFFDQASPLVSQVTHQINNPNSLVNNDVNSVLQDRNGNFWFATNNGISSWNVSTGIWKSFYYNTQEQAQVFLSLGEDLQGRIWAGTYSSGFYIIDGQTGKELAHYYDGDGNSFSCNYVFDIFCDSEGDVWVGGAQSNLICYLAKEGRFQKYPSYPLYAINQLSKNEFLLACTYGLVILNKDTGKGQNIMPDHIVNDIHLEEGTVWVGTSGDGLIKFDIRTKSISKFTIEAGLPSNFVNSVLHDGRYLWLGTENGLCRFDPENAFIQTYRSFLPLSNVSYNQNSRFRSVNGQLIWGTNQGVILFHPRAIQQFKAKGKIFFQDLTVLGKTIRERLSVPIDSLSELKLKHFQNTFSLEVLPIGTTSGSKFSWKLEGLDPDWSTPTSHRVINYTNVPGKSLQLKVRLYDESLSEILDERRILIKMMPPFWGTWWFMIFAFLLITGVIYFLFWSFISELKQKYTKEKIRFFTNTAHEIRTSLTLIKAPVEELSKERSLSEKGKYYLQMASEQASRLSGVVSHLMDFQKADMGKEQVVFTTLDVVEMIGRRIRMFETFAGKKNIEIQFSSNCETCLVSSNELFIERITDNLISNALKYSPPDSKVAVILTVDQNKWAIQVSDQGIGISKKDQRHLFNEFYRAENAINTKIVGSGIGLLLVKKYVTLLKGEISFESQENQGSTFKISFPVVLPSGTGSIEHLTDNDDGQLTSTQLDIPESLSEEGTEEVRFHILIVEDNEDLLNFMEHALSADFDILGSANGLLAWELLQRELPDLVVSDVMMPNMDGFELCRLIKSTYETSHIPVILLSALSGKAEQLQGLGLGADDYQTKPFDIDILRKKILNIILSRDTIRKKALGQFSRVSDEPIVSNNLNDRFLKRMLEVVKNNMANTEFGKDEFAFDMNVSSSLLYKKVKALTGQSPTDFIKNIRLEHAFELLSTQKYSITEISELSGFASIGYFSTVFKKHFGKTPSEFIKSR